MDNKSIRKKIRSFRNALSYDEQQNLSSLIVENIISSTLFKKSKNFALFLPNDNEPDLSRLIAYAWAKGKNCYLPVLGQKFEPRLSFQLYTPDSQMIFNRYGIPEPFDSPKTRLKSWRLDLILMPLVAFDCNGNRIGMGGGFYDRTLQYRRYRKIWQKPPLMGVAYAEQQLTSAIKAENWDIPLDYIATNGEIKSFRKK